MKENRLTVCNERIYFIFEADKEVDRERGFLRNTPEVVKDGEQQVGHT